MKPSLWALVLSLFMAGAAEAQPPEPSLPTNAPATNSAQTPPPPPGFVSYVPTTTNMAGTNSVANFEETRTKAEKGDAEAQFSLGRAFYNGTGVVTNFPEAVNWWRKSADQGHGRAQAALGDCYCFGDGVPQDYTEAAKWYRKAAESGNSHAQFNLGVMLQKGKGVAKDDTEAVKWFRKAAEQGDVDAKGNLATCYLNGIGVPKDALEAVRLLRPLAESGHSFAQGKLGVCYEEGKGVPKDSVEAYKWFNLAAAQGDEGAARMRSYLEKDMTPTQVAEAQRLAREFIPREKGAASNRADDRDSAVAKNVPRVTGTGFFVTDDGCLLTSYHVVEDAARISIRTQAGTFQATLVKADKANDIALLKVTGSFPALPVVSSRGVKLGESVFTIGFPNIELQGFAPKLTKGEISSLAGAQDDPRYFQISAPLQPGNSGGALVDDRGNVVGVVSAKLDAATALAASGALPENVNYAIKSSFLLSFLESVPDVAAKMKEPGTKEEKLEDAVKSAQQAAALVLIY